MDEPNQLIIEATQFIIIDGLQAAIKDLGDDVKQLRQQIDLINNKISAMQPVLNEAYLNAAE